VHTITLKALKAPVTVMGVFSYDMRSNTKTQRVIHGVAADSEFRFEPAFKAVPVMHCSGTLKIKSITPQKAVFSGSGHFVATGE
jgi:predicted nucleic acid-binding Zn ribbon protein